MRLEYPVWNNGKAEMTPLDELSEDYKKNKYTITKNGLKNLITY